MHGRTLERAGAGWVGCTGLARAFAGFSDTSALGGELGAVEDAAVADETGGATSDGSLAFSEGTTLASEGMATALGAWCAWTVAQVKPTTMRTASPVAAPIRGRLDVARSGVGRVPAMLASPLTSGDTDASSPSTFLVPTTSARAS